MIETLTSEGRAIIQEFVAKRQAKEAKRKAFWDHYHEQLKKGNSNIGNGATHKAHRRIMANKIC